VAVVLVHGEGSVGGHRRELSVLDVLVVLVIVLEVLGHVGVLVRVVGQLAGLALVEGCVHFGGECLLSLLLFVAGGRLVEGAFVALARAETLAGHADARLVDAVVVVQAAQRAVRPVVGAAVERWLDHGTRIAPTEAKIDFVFSITKISF